jgi:hypothetical protein
MHLGGLVFLYWVLGRREDFLGFLFLSSSHRVFKGFLKKFPMIFQFYPILKKFAKSRLFFPSCIWAFIYPLTLSNELCLKVLINDQTPKLVSPPILQQYHNLRSVSTLTK